MHNGSRTRQACQAVQIGYLRSTGAASFLERILDLVIPVEAVQNPPDWRLVVDEHPRKRVLQFSLPNSPPPADPQECENLGRAQSIADQFDRSRLIWRIFQVVFPGDRSTIGWGDNRPRDTTCAPVSVSASFDLPCSARYRRWTQNGSTTVARCLRERIDRAIV